jgi:hypothetical protein
VRRGGGVGAKHSVGRADVRLRRGAAMAVDRLPRRRGWSRSSPRPYGALPNRTGLRRTRDPQCKGGEFLAAARVRAVMGETVVRDGDRLDLKFG